MPISNVRTELLFGLRKVFVSVELGAFSFSRFLWIGWRVWNPVFFLLRRRRLVHWSVSFFWWQTLYQTRVHFLVDIFPFTSRVNIIDGWYLLGRMNRRRKRRKLKWLVATNRDLLTKAQFEPFHSTLLKWRTKRSRGARFKNSVKFMCQVFFDSACLGVYQVINISFHPFKAWRHHLLIESQLWWRLTRQFFVWNSQICWFVPWANPVADFLKRGKLGWGKQLVTFVTFIRCGFVGGETDRQHCSSVVVLSVFKSICCKSGRITLSGAGVLAKSNLFMFKQALGNVLLGKPMGHLALFAIQAPVSFLFCCLLGTGVIVIDRVFWTVVSIPSGLRGVVTTTQQTFEWFLSFGTMKFVFVGLFDLLIWLLGGNSLTFSSRWFYFCWLFFWHNKNINLYA